MFCKRPKIARKNTKAAAAEATEVATKAKASVRMEEIKSLPAEYETMDCGTGTEALVQAVEPGDLLRERWFAHTLLRESDHCAATIEKMSWTHEAAATETAVNAAVAAAAAAEAASASKAAAAHEALPLPRRTSGALSTCARPLKSPTCLRARQRRDTHGRRGLFRGGRCLEWGGSASCGDGAWVVAAPRHGLRRGHRDGLRPSAFARESTRRIAPRPCIRG